MTTDTRNPDKHRTLGQCFITVKIEEATFKYWIHKEIA
jgi:hypothetical protein